jgi:hypothetical protein
MTNGDYTISFLLDRYERQRRAQEDLIAARQAPLLAAIEAEKAATISPQPLGSKVIHITDLQDFCRCKRAWYWSSMLHMGLQPAVSPAPLFFGSAIHFALDHGYRGCVGEAVAYFDLKAALAAFKSWIRQHVKRTVEYTGPLWEFESDQVDDARRLGVLMLRHYALWAAPLDKLFKVLGMEYKFKVPLPGYESHGMEYAGRFDGYLEDLKSGRRYILEFKTAKSIRSRQSGKRSSNIEGVLRGMQSAAYTWASGQVYPEPAQGVLYRFLCKKAPGMPKLLQNGGYSRAKSISSSVPWYQYVLRKIAEEKVTQMAEENIHNYDADVIYNSEIAQASQALAVLRQRQDIQHGLVVGNEFFSQLAMSKKPAQVKGALDCLVNEGARMIHPEQAIYPTSGFHCNWCQFKSPCDMIAYGHEEQVEAILAAAYGPRTYWEPEVQEEY